MTNKFTVRYLPIAQSDLENIITYIKKDNPTSADELLKKIDQKIAILSSFPQTGSKPKDERLQKLGYRTLIIDKYIVFYVVIDDVVEIRRILHGSRNYSFLL
jgi:toxin ParE1/3/4